MTKLEQLIEELCPNGVEYHELGKIAEMQRGTSITKKNVCEGEIPVISGGREPAYYCDTFNREGETITVAGSGAGAGYVQYWDRPIFVCDAFSIKGNEQLSTKYLYYFLTSIQEFIYSTKKGGGVPHVHVSSIEHVQIPVPPLPVQSEIVRILDNFTELTAELTARKKQYEYYRTKLLERPENESKMVSVANLGKWSGGKTPSTANKEFWENGTIPWISSKDMKAPTLEDTEDHLTEKALDEGGMALLPEGTIAVVTRSGILKHTFPVAYVPFKTTVNQDIKALVVKEGISSRYVFHALQAYAENIRKSTKKQGGTVDSLDFQRVLAYEIPVPALDVQNRLVNVLDNFDAICSDLKIGLPAEIEARKKQYELYREQLLTFAEGGRTILTDRQTDRQTDEYNALIRLCQYVFGYVLLPLEKIFDIRNGYTPSKTNPEYWTNGTVDWFRMEDIRMNGHVLSSALQKVTEAAVKGGRKIPANSIALSTSATIGEHALITVECLGNQRFSFFTPKAAFADMVNMRFMNYYFYKVDEWCKGHLFQGNFNSVDMGALKQLCVPIPTTSEQERIVSILDRFDALCNDLTSGLPAEIEARTKQYEYYRDKLLTFKEQ